jgi:hypothetical protein
MTRETALQALRNVLIVLPWTLGLLYYIRREFFSRRS